MTDCDAIRCVVVKLHDGDYIERAWVACSLAETTYDLLDEEEWQDWKRKALDLCLADWRSYEIREVVVQVPQAALEGLFSAEPIQGTVK